jgi:hypothetical protein
MTKMISLFDSLISALCGKIVSLLRSHEHRNKETMDYNDMYYHGRFSDDRAVTMALGLINKERYGFDDEPSTLEHLAGLALDDSYYIRHFKKALNELTRSEAEAIESPRISLDRFRESHSACPYSKNIYGVNFFDEIQD